MTCTIPYVWGTPDDLYSTLCVGGHLMICTVPYVWRTPDELYITLCVGDT